MPKEPVLYEAMYIVPVDMSEEEIAALEARLKVGLEREGAQVDSVHEFSRRRLAYPILGHTEGIYRIMYFRGDGAAVDELKHEMSLSEEIIRGSVVVANPKYMVGQQPAPAQVTQAEEEEPEEPKPSEESDESDEAPEPQDAPDAEQEPAAGTAEASGADEAPETQQ